MAYDLRRYNPGSQSWGMQVPGRQWPGRQVQGWQVPEVPGGQDTGGKAQDMQVPEVQVPDGQAPGSKAPIREKQDAVTVSPIAASEISDQKPLLDLEPESILKGILFSELLAKPKSMRGRR